MRKMWPSARRPKEDEALDCLAKTILSHVSVKNLNFRLKVSYYYWYIYVSILNSVLGGLHGTDGQESNFGT